MPTLSSGPAATTSTRAGLISILATERECPGCDAAQLALLVNQRRQSPGLWIRMRVVKVGSASVPQGADAAESPADPIARMMKRARDSLIRRPFLSSGATRVAGSVDLLKGRDGYRMSIDSVKRPSGRCHENLLSRPARNASTDTFWIAIRSRWLYRGALQKYMLGAQF